MPTPILSAPTLLKENILFLTAGTFLSSIVILLFDHRLYTAGEVFLLFVGTLILFLIHAFAGSMQQQITKNKAVLLYLRSFLTSFSVLGLLYAFLLPFPFDLFLTLKLSLLVTLIETSIHFFIRYHKQFGLTEEKQRVINQTIKQQQVKELEVLKQQIDPHFIFNSFNTLTFLIDEDRERAKQFSNRLANVYRYIIFNSNKNLVSINDEIGFAKDYAYLQEIRHSNEIKINFSVPLELENLFVLPVSLQILLENAIKHNEFKEEYPLVIDVNFENNAFVVTNNINTKNYNVPSSKIGLANLRDRCRLILGKDLAIIKEKNSFKVVLPLLRK
ncbi:MAG TPA: histidine kinase [Flavisolibacter sp.]|jgi:sensor histidine kinase YesM